MNTLIIVGTDGTETAQRAVLRAAELARDTGSALHVLSAYATEAPASLTDEQGATEADIALTHAGEAASAVTDEHPGLAVTSGATRGAPAEALVRAATAMDASMIVVGNKRVQGLARVLGSIAGGVAHHAPCDVLIVHTS